MLVAVVLAASGSRPPLLANGSKFGRANLGAIEQVRELGPELEALAFRQPETLVQRQNQRLRLAASPQSFGLTGVGSVRQKGND